MKRLDLCMGFAWLALVLGGCGAAIDGDGAGQSAALDATPDYDGVPIQPAAMAQYAADLCALRGELINSNVYRSSPDGRYLAIARCPASGSYVERIDTRTQERVRVGEICTRGCFASGNIRTWTGGFLYVDREPSGLVVTMLDWDLTNRRRVELENTATTFKGHDAVYLAETSGELVFAYSSGSSYTWHAPMPAAGATVTAHARHDAAAAPDPDLSLEAYVEKSASGGYKDDFTANGHHLHVTRFSSSAPNGWSASITDADGATRVLPTDALPSYMTSAADQWSRVRIALSRDGAAAFVAFQASFGPRVTTTEVWRLDETGPSRVFTIPWTEANEDLVTQFVPMEAGVFALFYRGDDRSNAVRERAVLFLQ